MNPTDADIARRFAGLSARDLAAVLDFIGAEPETTSPGRLDRFSDKSRDRQKSVA